MAKLRILIVEDEYIIALDIRKRLEKNGYIVSGQTDCGEEAIKLANVLHPDLILMDIGLKGEMDGVETAKQIRSQFNLPVIFLTAFANLPTIERARHAEPYGYILKPFEEQELVSNIEMAVFKHGMELKLKDSEARFRRLANSAPDIIFRYDLIPEKKLTYINPTVEIITGYTPDECCANPNLMFNLIHPEDLEKMSIYVESLTIPDGPLFMRWVGKDGTIRWMESRIIPVLDTNEELIAVEGITRDITERKQAEDAISNSEKRFRSLIENGRDNVSVLAADGTLLWEGPSTAFSLGYTQNQFVDHNIFELMHPDDKGWTAEFFMQVAQEPKSSQGGIFRLLHANGSWRWVEATATNLLHESNIQGIVINYRDITERKQAEDALRESEDKFRKVVENASDGISLIDNHGNVVEWNPAAEIITGLKSSEVIGRPITDAISSLLPKEKREASHSKEFRANQLQALIKRSYTDLHRMAEYEIETTQGQPRIIQTNGFVVNTSQGVMAGVILRDITERKLAEDTLRESEEKHRTLFESMAQGVIYQSAEGHIIHANPAAMRILGLTLDQLMGRTSIDPRWKAIHEDGSEFPGDTHPAMLALKTGKEVQNVVMGVFHPVINKYSWINIHAVPKFKPGEAKPYQVYTTFEDFTERKEMSDTLRHSRNMIMALSRAAQSVLVGGSSEEIYKTVGEQIKELGFESTILTISNDQRISVSYTTFSSQLLQDSANLAGVSVSNFRFPFSQDSIIGRIIKTGKAHFFNQISDLITEALPNIFKSASRQLERTLKISQGIIVPLRVDGKTTGLFTVGGAGLTEEDVPAFEIFTAQVGISLRNAHLNNQLLQAFANEQELAHTDELTGIHNRRSLFQLSEHEFETAFRYQRPLSMIMFDLDHFKMVNDTFGHVAGDYVLQQITKLVSVELRSADVFGRYGGEEFVILMPEIKASQACQVAERVRRLVADNPIPYQGSSISVTLSIGVTELNKDMQGLDELVQYVDQALYKAKSSGRNCVANFPEN